MMIAVKSCRRCGTTKPRTQFHRNNQSRDGLHPWCAACKNAASVGYYQRWTPEQRLKHRRRVLRNRHGVDVEFIDNLYEKQARSCAICGRPGSPPFSADGEGRKPSESLQVDHDHATGLIRGLLCFECNTGIGKLGESPERLQQAIQYLREGGQ